MSKKIIISLSFALIVAVSAGVFVLGSFGSDMTLATKIFIVFFGSVIGFQFVPAVLLFSCLVKGVFFGKDAMIDHTNR